MNARQRPAAPLKPAWLQILLCLAEDAKHGYAIMQEVDQRTGGTVKLWPTTLYGSIGRMESAGLLEGVDVDEPDDDERRQYYAITTAGRGVLRDEIARLEGLVALARDLGATE